MSLKDAQYRNELQHRSIEVRFRDAYSSPGNPRVQSSSIPKCDTHRDKTIPLRNPWNFPEFLSPQGRTCVTPTTSRASDSQGILETPDGLYHRSRVPTTTRNALSTHRRSAWWGLNWTEREDAGREGEPLPRNGKHASLMDMRAREYRFIESVRGMVRRRDFLV